MLSTSKQIELMGVVLDEVKAGIRDGDNPFAGVLVNSDGKIIEKAHNSQISSKDRTAHAEILLISQASKKLNLQYLYGYSVVLNSEPCAMCMSLLVKAKVDAVYYGASQDEGNDPLIRADEIVKRSNYKVLLIGGILKKECENIIFSKRQEHFIL
jgi:tRNA(adenine34) deaminase